MTSGRSPRRRRSRPPARAAACSTPPAIARCSTVSAPAIQQVDVLSIDAARQLLSELTGERPLPDRGRPLLEATGRVAWRSHSSGPRRSSGIEAGSDVLDELRIGGETFLDHPYADVFKAMQVAIGALSEIDRRAYHALAVYPEDTVIPVAAIARLWSHLFDTDRRADTRAAASLAADGLLVVEPDGVALPRPPTRVPPPRSRAPAPAPRRPARRLPHPPPDEHRRVG